MGMMIALNEKATMSNELNGMHIRKPMTLQQLRFFTIYLAKINPDNPEEKVVRFSMKDFASIMNVEVNEDAIKTNVVNLLEHTVWVKSKKYKNGITACHLFKKCEIWEDAAEGKMMEFQCSEEVEPYLFQLKSNFTTYEVWNTLRLRSVTNSRMYQLLKQFQKIGERTILIDDLKEQLGIDKNAYPEYKVFSRDVLKKAQDALREKTDICFDYTSIGRPAKSIRFTIYKNEDYDKQISLDEIGFIGEEPSEGAEPHTDELPGQMNITDFPELLPDEPTDPMMKAYEFLSGACDDEFTTEQIKELSRLANDHVKFTLSREEHDLSKFDYIRKKYLALNAKPQEAIHSRYGLLKYLVENDC